MGVDRGAFARTRTDEERAEDKSQVIAIRFNKEELAKIEEAAKALSQEKVSTAVKQLVDLGLLCLHDEKTLLALEIQRENHRRNTRLGITEAQPRFTR